MNTYLTSLTVCCLRSLSRGAARTAAILSAFLVAFLARNEGTPAAVSLLKAPAAGDRLMAVSGSGSDVWAVGAAGAIVRSADDGASWSRGDSGTTATLKGVWASGAHDVWIVGSEGTILRSTDGGIHWRGQAAPASVTWNGIWGSGATDVYIAGDQGHLLHSSDGGRSFQDLRPLGDTDESFTCIWGNDRNDIYVGGSRGSLLASVDGGAHWQTRWPQTARRTQGPRVAPPAKGIIVLSLAGGGHSRLLAVILSWGRTRKGSAASAALARTDDGGLSWHLDTKFKPPASLSTNYGPFLAFDARTIYGAATFDDDRSKKVQGFVVSRDGGATFERVSTFDLPIVDALWHSRSGAWVAVGAEGKILRSTDGGRSWQPRIVEPFGTRR